MISKGQHSYYNIMIYYTCHYDYTKFAHLDLWSHFRLCSLQSTLQSTTSSIPPSLSWLWHALIKTSTQREHSRFSSKSLFSFYHFVLCCMTLYFSIHSCIILGKPQCFSTTASSQSRPCKGSSPPWCSSWFQWVSSFLLISAIQQP